MGTLINKSVRDALERALSGSYVVPGGAGNALIGELAFSGFYRHNVTLLQDMRGYTGPESQVSGFVHTAPFMAHMKERYSQVILLATWKSDMDYFVFMSRSPRRLILASQDGSLMLETDEPAELFAAINEILRNVDPNRSGSRRPDEFYVAQHMLSSLAWHLDESAKTKRLSAVHDEESAKTLDASLRAIGYNRNAPFRL